MLNNSYSRVSEWNKPKSTVKTCEMINTHMHADYMSTIIKQLTLNAKCVNHWHEISASHDYLLIQITLKTKINIE